MIFLPFDTHRKVTLYLIFKAFKLFFCFVNIVIVISSLCLKYHQNQR